MLWRTSPAATELEAVALGWLRRLVGLPDTFEGVIYDTASIGTLHALVAAREAAVSDVRAKGLAARDDVPRIRVYCSDQTHSSIDKAVITTGLGHEALRKIPTDDRFRMRVDALDEEIRKDRRDGVLPIAVVATVGTTSPPASIRSARLPRSASASACGFTSTPRTAAWPPCCRLTFTYSPAPIAPTR
jgi:aromatic-L-amino-acid decarboxylase